MNRDAADARPRHNPALLGRREFVGASIGAGLAATAGTLWLQPHPGHALSVLQQPTIRPRSDWDQGHAATGPIKAETPQFLLVHHTAQPGNDYIADDVPALLRSMYWYHTGDEKGWPDIAYNFLVDQFGTIWEGRTGSIAGPVQGSATGGNQGFSQLCCFIGNLDESDPTAAASEAMVNLLAWLATQRSIDVHAEATTTFVSRGSNKWPTGTTVTTPTIAGHRDMSQTGCPGERGYAFVTQHLVALVSAKLTGTIAPPTTEPTTTTSTSTTEPTTTTSTSSPTSTTSSTEALTPSTTTGAAAPDQASLTPTGHEAAGSLPQTPGQAPVDGPKPSQGRFSVRPGQIAASLAVALGGTGLLLLRRRTADGVDSAGDQN